MSAPRDALTPRGDARAWHLLTAEYPPSLGGVADYTRQVARALAAAGDRVHVWCSRVAGDDALTVDAEDAVAGVTVHRAFDRFVPAELHAAAEEARRDASVRWVVQWVPHQFGWKAMNVALPVWLAYRAREGDAVELMLHEGALPFVRGRWRQNAAAVVQRLMLGVAVRAADRIWLSIPQWETLLRRVGGRVLPTRSWLPVPSNIPVVDDAPGVEAWRQRLSPDGAPLVGIFGTFGPPIGGLVEHVAPAILARNAEARVAFLGPGGPATRERVAALHPRHASRIVAPGALPARDVSLAVQACDLMVQPYPDGVSGRRGSTMVALVHARPLVTNVGPLSEPLWHGGAVRLALEAPADMAAAVAALLADDEERRRVAAAGSALYASLFSIDRVVSVLRGDAQPAVPDTVPSPVAVS